MDEFEIIRRYFSTGYPAREDVALAVGDDGAITRLPDGEALVTVTDSLVAGTHFPVDIQPDALAHRALAANLSDLAAMGTQPRWFTLALALSEPDAGWLESFSTGLRKLATRYGVALIGGDTVRGPLAVTIAALGSVPEQAWLTRSGAKPGDSIFLSGTTGEAGWVWQEMADGRLPVTDDPLYRRFAYPEPRVEAGIALRGLATACIDISDGLHVDLGRLLTASGKGGEARLDLLPLSADLVERVGKVRALELALTGGDDYELCFTAGPDREGELQALSSAWRLDVTRIGRVTAAPGLRWYDPDGPVAPPVQGFRHF